ncbi:MAG: hypothetical protein KKH98_13915 [Spirochaetes bacterium]|nr:hypothetical protein [Spirochaetota bacterium]
MYKKKSHNKLIIPAFFTAIGIYFVVFFLIYNFLDLDNIRLLLPFIILFLVNTVLIIIDWLKRYTMKNMQQIDFLCDSFLYSKNDKTILESFIFYFFSNLYVLCDVNFNIIRHFTKDKENKNHIRYHNIIDRLIILYMILSILIFSLGSFPGLFLYQLGIIFIVWRILSILITKLQEIFRIQHKISNRSMFSLNRTLYLTGFNFFELIFEFSCLYIFFNLISNKTDAFLGVLNIFASFGISPKINPLCIRQKILIIVQIFIFMEFIIFFISNIMNLNYENFHKKRKMKTQKRKYSRKVKQIKIKNEK